MYVENDDYIDLFVLLLDHTQCSQAQLDVVRICRLAGSEIQTHMGQKSCWQQVVPISHTERSFMK